MRKSLLLCLLIFTEGVILTPEASACSCIEPPAPAIAYSQYDAVFLAEAVTFKRAADKNRRVAGMLVYEVWKGEVWREQPVYTALHSAACGFDFQIDEMYVVYASRDENGDLRTNICTRTALQSNAPEDLRYLNARRYFPLEIDNQWKFSREVVETVKDTVRFNEALFYRFDSFRDFQDAALRLTNEGEVVMRHEGLEQVWIKFGAEIGDSWEVRSADSSVVWTVHLQSVSDTVRVEAGEFSDCFRFYFQFHGADNDWVEWYAPGIGPVKRDLSGIAFFEFDLQEANIQPHGTVTFLTNHDAPEKRFRLAQNYPNPFTVGVSSQTKNSPLTTIRYDLRRDGFVKLEIINVLGRVVRTLVKAHMRTGLYEIAWNGEEENGSAVAGGIYFYRLQLGDQHIVKKMLVIH